MFRTVPLSIISSLALYTQQWHMSYRFADSLRAGSGRNQFRMTFAIAALTACEQDPDGTSCVRILLPSFQETCMTYAIAVLTACEQDPDGTGSFRILLYDIYHCCVYSEKLLMMDR